MQSIVAAFRENPGFNTVDEAIESGKLPLHVTSLDNKLQNVFIESVTKGIGRKLIVTYDERRAQELVDNYKLYNRNAYYYPAKDVLFYYADVHNNVTAQKRLDIFKRISEGEDIIVVTSIDGLMDKIPPLSSIVGGKLKLSVNDTVSEKDFSKKLTDLGYEKVYMVEEAGQFSVRGGIIDIFPLTEECPYRVELWGDDIESIRMFDVESQRSITECDEIEVYPSGEMVLSDTRIRKGLDKIKKEFKTQYDALRKEFRTEQAARLESMVKTVEEELMEFNSTMGLDSMVEYFYDETVSFLDYFDDDTFVFIDEPEKVMQRSFDYETEFAYSMQSRLEGGYVLPTQANVLYDSKKTCSRLSLKKCILMSDIYKKQPGWGEKGHLNMPSKDLISYNNSFEQLVSDILKWKKKNYKIIIMSPSATRGKRLAGNLKDNNIDAYFTDDNTRAMKPAEVMVLLGRVDTGFESDDSKLVVISESDIFTSKDIKKRKKLPKYKGDKISGFADISVGDYVVHERHGVGIYRGIDKVETDGRLKDYISIEYAKGSKLFIPVEQLDMIGKLSGKDGATKKLNRLGGGDWEKVRQRVRGHVDDIADELMRLNAIRSTTKGFAFAEDTVWQREFEELFPYEETLDQQKAIEDTKHDMESDKIMDRLVCGDVGFGKTEVAIRAAFKAVQDNKQVAYLVPTTILAEQHYENFCERMKDFPINIKMLSRFCTAKEVKDTLEKMKSGLVDIVIGTHRLLSKDIEFNNLGLLIIDEEQRFGVKHKEQIKHLKQNVDVLTLTATPIPRTLHMSLVGLRDISLLQEPPVDRMPIQTFIMEYNLEFVKEAINRELTRNGQVYYVYNRVNSIDQITNELRSVLPSATIEFAHGKMNERELEDIMHRFIKKEIDVLVSTTIIETGLDIPNVNTIIIHDADNFGLSQLYQLRGRVGRSNRSAYAFLLYKRDKMIKEVAEKRLKAIRDFTELGSGYKISMKDLEIRGAGNLIGQEQSGNIEAVGYDLYCKMLHDAIRKLNGDEVTVDFNTAVELPLDAYIPDTYVKNEYMKLDLYKRISKCMSLEENDAIIEEVKDRFGEPPKSFMRLLDVANIKSEATKAYITEIKYINDEVRFTVWPEAPVKPERMDMLLKRYKGRMRFIPNAQPELRVKSSKLIQEELVEDVLKCIEDIKLLTEERQIEEVKKDRYRFKRKAEETDSN